MNTAFLLNNRSLEIYVTLPSAEKRLFVDVQEEVSVPKEPSSHRSKRLKVDDEQIDLEQSLPSSQSASTPASVASSSKTTSGTVSVLSSLKASAPAREQAPKPTHAPLTAKDPNASALPAKERKSSSLSTLKVPSDATPTESNKTTAPPTKTHKPESVPPAPYATFDQVKLNVRVKPTLSSIKDKAKHGSGINVATLPKKTGKLDD